MNRRMFIEGFGAFTAVSLCGCATGRGKEPVVRFGMVTDIHFADHDPDPKPCGVVGRRYYRESKRKLDAAMAVFNRRDLDFVIELGDFKDLSATKESTLSHLREIEGSFAAFRGPRYHVLGNHDFDCLTPEEFFAPLTNGGRPMTRGHYSFMAGDRKFVVLDACYDSRMNHYSRNNPWDDANVPPDELEWLKRELAAAKGRVMVFCHQRLDPSSEPKHLVRNAAAVREVLERSGKVSAVITGHQHKGGFNVVNGITYYSLRALVCDSGDGANSFAEVAVYADGSFSVTGWRNAVSYGAEGEFPERGLVAHRGDSAEFPEDTLPAFASAVAKGAAMVELDEWRCRTGELVVMHDGEVSRTTNGKGRLADLSLDEIRALDAGSKKGVQFAGEKVPTLQEAIRSFPRAGLLLNIHCKTGDAAPEVAKMLRDEGRLYQGILMCDSRAALENVKAMCPWARTGLVGNTKAGWERPWSEEEAWETIRYVAAVGAEFLQVLPNCHCTKEQMRFLRDHGIRTTYFVANDAKTMREIVAEGHDFVFTDRYSELEPIYRQEAGI